MSLGKDSYHAEAVFGADGTVRLYTLGKDEARVQEVEVQELTGHASATGSTAGATEVPFVAQPQQGDAAGKTSLFVGRLPAGLVGKPVQVTINNPRIGSDRFRVPTLTNEPTPAHGEAMPAAVGRAEARELHLTPGGKYTAADVAANGNITPGAKYKGVKSDHNAGPSPGDRICPVSMTKANPRFAWAVGGKTYEFCRTPCVDEFVQTAKANPGDIKEPGEYVKK